MYKVGRKIKKKTSKSVCKKIARNLAIAKHGEIETWQWQNMEKAARNQAKNMYKN